MGGQIVSTVTGEHSVRVTVPGIGEATVTSGVSFFDVRFGSRYANADDPTDTEPVTINGKTYGMVTATVTHDGIVKDARGSVWFGYLTPSAEKKVRDAVAEWAPAWCGTETARKLAWLTIDRHNRINADALAAEIADDERALAAKRELLRATEAQVGKADAVYVSRYA